MRLFLASLLSLSVGCADTNTIIVELAPEVISSLDGTLSVRAITLDHRELVTGAPISLTVDYLDRHGTSHDIATISGETDDSGTFEATFTGLDWDGTGTVTASIEDSTVQETATFAVLDRTPPKVTITPPASNQVRIGNDVTITVHVTDEIGVSQVFFEATAGNRDRSTVIASGSTDTSVGFDLKVENVSVGSTITLYALAADLSGNQAAAPPVTVMVAP